MSAHRRLSASFADVLLTVSMLVALLPTSTAALGTPQIVSVSPGSGVPVGTNVCIRVSVSWDSDFRSMRLRFGSQGWQESAETSFQRCFDTSGMAPGWYTIRVEAARWGDNNWSSPASTEQSYQLTPGAAPPAPPSQPSVRLTVAPTSVGAGQSVSASWSGLASTGNDWISLHPAGAPDSQYLTWQSAPGSSGTLTFAAPSSTGDYDVRLFRNGSRVATSNTFRVQQQAPYPPQSEGYLVIGSSGPAWVLRGGERHLVPDVDTLNAIYNQNGRHYERWGDDAINRIPRGSDEPSVNQQPPQQPRGGGTDDARMVAQANYPTVGPGDPVSVWFTVQNSGTNLWPAGGGDGYRYRGTDQWAGRWWNICCNLAPGQQDTFRVDFNAPQQAGTYRYGMMLNHNGRDFGPYFFIDVSVVSPSQSSSRFNAGDNVIRCGPGTSFSGCYANGEYGDGGNDAAWRGADGDLGTQWSSLEHEQSYWQATFQQSVTIAQVSVWGRGGGDSLAGRLEFSDGSTVDMGSLNGDGSRTSVCFAPRATTRLRFQVTGMGNRNTTGFREIEAYHLAPRYSDGRDCGGAGPGSSNPPGSPPSTPEPGQPQIGQRYGLARGTHIHTGAGFGYPSTIPQVPWGGVVPEDNWTVLITGGPVCADGWSWWNTDRRAAGDPSGGTGWAAILQGCSAASQPPNPPGGGSTGNPPTGGSSSAGVQLCAHINYGGVCEAFSGDDSDLRDNSVGNDRTSSLRVPSGQVVALYEHTNFAGRCQDFTSDTASLVGTYIGNDITSSIRVGTRCASGGGGSGRPAPSWSVSLSASDTSVPAGSSVTLTARANQDVGPTPYYIVILTSDNAVVASCGRGTSCSVGVSSSGGSRTYRAVIGDAAGGNVQDSSDPVTITWTGWLESSPYASSIPTPSDCNPLSGCVPKENGQNEKRVAISATKGTCGSGADNWLVRYNIDTPSWQGAHKTRVRFYASTWNPFVSNKAQLISPETGTNLSRPELILCLGGGSYSRSQAESSWIWLKQ